MTDKFLKIKEIVAQELNQTKDSAHDIDHVMRVYNLAMTIAKAEPNVDLDVLRASVLLHDIGGAKEANDPSGQTDHAVIGVEMARPILEDLGFADDKIKHIQSCILSHRHRTDNKPETIEAKIIYDADKLDASGAIGIARAFSWIGKHKAKIYKKVDDLSNYAKENLSEGKLNGRIMDKSKHSIHINYELKDKFLLENLYTETAKKIGRERLMYFKDFLERMDKEVNGEL
ncbi:MAG: HD domain-containing protein [Patescibacteria group bacterium]|nr:HD domain-containing protein [Patescibacteria group bacterium]